MSTSHLKRIKLSRCDFCTSFISKRFCESKPKKVTVIFGTKIEIFGKFFGKFVWSSTRGNIKELHNSTIHNWESSTNLGIRRYLGRVRRAFCIVEMHYIPFDFCNDEISVCFSVKLWSGLIIDYFATAVLVISLLIFYRA